MQIRPTPVLLVVLIALVAAIAIACAGASDNGGSGSQDVTPGQAENGGAADATDQPDGTEPGATDQPAGTEPHLENGASEDPELTQDELARETFRDLRKLESGVRSLSSFIRELDNSVAPISLAGRTPQELTEDWFEECCENAQEDISEELLETERELVDLLAVYQEAGDERRVQIAQQLGTHLANIEALVTVLARLPTSQGATSILEDLSLELVGFSEALAGLG